MKSLVNAAIRPFLRAWIVSSSESWRALRTPSDRPRAHTVGDDADRVLIVGNGIAVGYGVLSHDLGLPGMLARRLTALTGRGTDVEVRAHPDMTASSAATKLSSTDVAKYDAVVAMLGGIEAVMLLPAKRWAEVIEGVIASMLDRAPTTGFYLVSVPSPDRLVRMPAIFLALTSAHARRLNTIAREVCSRYPNATFIDFQPTKTRVVDSISKDSYGNWAGLIAPSIAAGLDRHVSGPQGSGNEDLRLVALDALHLDESFVDTELDKLVVTARDLFGASGAAVNAIDRTRQWSVAAVGLPRGEVPREFSVCATTVGSGKILVVEDTDRDETFRWKEWVLEDGMVRFYAGYPIESPNGERIGALCVVDVRPRRFTHTDRALLRELAMHAQSVLWDRYSTTTVR